LIGVWRDRTKSGDIRAEVSMIFPDPMVDGGAVEAPPGV
jgi:hypothetical protein